MATLKYQDENGNYVTITQYKVNDLQIVQTVGDSDEKVMSQKSVTDELNKLVDFSQLPKTDDGSVIINCGKFGK